MLALFGVLATFAAPALATNSTAPVTVQWNTTYTINLAINTNYTTAGAVNAAPGKLFTNNNGSTGTCTAATANETNGDVTIGNISPAAAVWTDCYYVNAINAYITTTDGNGYNLTAGLGAAGTTNIPVAQAANFNVCLFPTAAFANNNGTGVTFSSVVANGSVPAVTSQAAAMCTTPHPNGAGLTGTAVATAADGTTTLFSNAGSASTGTNIGYDVEVGIAGGFQCTAASTCTVPVTFAANGL